MNGQREEQYDTRSCDAEKSGRSVATLMREETSVARAVLKGRVSGASMWPLASSRVFAKFSPQRLTVRS